jgi:predicted nicotinamide N-methyase
VGPTWQRRERGNVVDELRKLEEEAPFGKYAKAAQAEWAEWTECAHGGLRAKRPGLLGAGSDGPESEEKLFLNKI